MIDAAEVERFFKNPSDLIDLCHEVVAQIDLEDDSEIDNASDKEKEVQLLIIARSIEQLAKAGVPVPDALRAEKIKLASSLGVQNQAKLALDLLYIGFDSITKVIKSKLQNYSGGAPQSTSPSTPRQFYREYIINSLKKFGGSASCGDVQEDVMCQLNDILLPGDFELYPGKSNKVRWIYNVHQERLQMWKEGIIKSGSPSGIWELAEDHK